jgi:hypothetical protein
MFALLLAICIASLLSLIPLRKVQVSFSFIPSIFSGTAVGRLKIVFYADEAGNSFFSKNSLVFF